MIEAIATFDLSTSQWLILALSGILVGMSKAGIAGIYYVVILAMAYIFGGKASTGVLLPMLIMADIFAVIYYNRSAVWKYVLRLFPWALGGVWLGTYVGNQISDETFKTIMGFIVLMGLGFMVWKEFRNQEEAVKDYAGIAAAVGLIAGFSTMVGNAAGAILAVYLLAKKLPKNGFIGTNAWFFMLINVSKVPFHIFSWETINLNSFLLNLTLLPAIAIGIWLGIRLVKLIPELAYRYFIIVITAISALILIF